MDFDVDRNTNDTGDPSLAEMTIKALRILANNPEGYFLFVEGIQKCHPAHLTLRAISQGRKLSNVLDVPTYASYNASLFSER